MPIRHFVRLKSIAFSLCSHKIILLNLTIYIYIYIQPQGFQRFLSFIFAPRFFFIIYFLFGFFNKFLLVKERQTKATLLIIKVLSIGTVPFDNFFFVLGPSPTENFILIAFKCYPHHLWVLEPPYFFANYYFLGNFVHYPHPYFCQRCSPDLPTHL